ncbi:MAG: biotin--[acetyl-CoA-carboxylase] ligase [Caldisericaceae bacterium]
MELKRNVVIVYETSSTMDLAKELSNTFLPPFIVRSFIQTKGRGQYERKWQSTYGGLYFTEVLNLNNILGFSTFLSIPILRVLKRYVEKVKVKWPNDIVIEKKKLGGILVEKSNLTFAGIGLNIQNDVKDVINSSISLKDFINIDKETIFWAILEEENNLINDFFKHGFRNFKREYEENLAILNRKTKVDLGYKIVEGVVVGVGVFGELLLDENGKMIDIFSGSIVNFYD